MTQEVFDQGPSVARLVIIITLRSAQYISHWLHWLTAIRSLLLANCEGPHCVPLFLNVLIVHAASFRAEL